MARGPKIRVRGHQVTLAKTGVLSYRDVQFSVSGRIWGGGEIRGGGRGSLEAFWGVSGLIRRPTASAGLESANTTAARVSQQMPEQASSVEGF